MIKTNLRKLFAAMLSAMLLLSFTACNENKENPLVPDYEQYEHLKTDIVGVWCDPEGPEFIEYLGEDGNDYSYYSIYEFTSDGKVVYHKIFPYTLGATYDFDEYTISDNFLDVNGAKCLIDVKDGILSMTSNSGTNTFRHMTMEELAEYVVDVQDPQLKVEKDAYVSSLIEDYYATSVTEETQPEGTAPAQEEPSPETAAPESPAEETEEIPAEEQENAPAEE